MFLRLAGHLKNAKGFTPDKPKSSGSKASGSGGKTGKK
jgi:hypothetical protein